MTSFRRLQGLRQGLVGLLCLIAAGYPAYAQVPEPQLKAAFVFNFVRYIEWPEKVFANKDAPITVCMVGREEGVITLSTLDGRKAQERTIKVRLEVSVDAAKNCQVVYIGDLDARRTSALIRSLQSLPVLTISDADGFIDNGGAIGIVRGDQRLQFEVNRSALDKAQLKASSQLLKLARAVLSPGS